MKYRRFIPSHDVAEPGGGLCASLDLLDDATGEPVRLDEVIAAYEQVTATGIFVKRRLPEAPIGRGVIVGFSDWAVFVHDRESAEPSIASIPRQQFHAWFQLD